MTNFFDNWDEECLFETTYQDVLNIKADVLIIMPDRVMFYYVFKNSKYKNEIRNIVRDNRLKYDILESKTDFSDHFFTTEGYDMWYKNIILAFIPYPQYYNDDLGTFSNKLRIMTLKILRHAVDNLSAKSIVFGYPGFDVNEKDFECFRTVVATVNTFIRTENPYLKVFMAVRPSHKKEHLYSQDISKKYTVVSNNTFVETFQDMKQSVGISDLLKRVENSVLDPAIYMEYSCSLKRRMKESGIEHKYFAKNIISEYLQEYKGKQSTLAKMVGCDASEISRYKNGTHVPRSKERMLAIALAIGLKKEDMYLFMNGGGYKYPEDFRDNLIELLHNYGENDFDTIKNLIEEVCYDYPPLVKDRYATDEEKQR